MTGDVPTPPPERRVVLLDSNALMMQFQFHVDIESELKRILDFDFDVVVPSTVLDELKGLTKKLAGKDAQEAKLAIELAKTFRIEKTDAEGDAGILRLAEKLSGIVVTNDKILRARLRAKGIPNVHMRSKAFLTLEGFPGL
ncbi:MAG: type II toxin-antitoxin system VapC family toxin [Methanobacteriota archaeon]